MIDHGSKCNGTPCTCRAKDDGPVREKFTYKGLYLIFGPDGYEHVFYLWESAGGRRYVWQRDMYRLCTLGAGAL